MQAVILSFDSLAANALGCYGNEWIETPHWDQLAASGVVFDRHFADTVGDRAGMAWANGRHALCPSSSPASDPIGVRLRSLGVKAKLIAAGDLQAWQGLAQFEETRTVDGGDGPGLKPDEVLIARLVKAGLSAWNEPSFGQSNRLLWLHASSPGRPPEGFGSLYFEDFEERGQRLADLSEEDLADHPAVYAGSVSLIDHWLGELLGTIESSAGAEPTLVIVTAAKGHLWHRSEPSSLSGDKRSDLLCDQQTRTPLVMKVNCDDRFSRLASLRSDRLVQTCDLVPTLFDWFGHSPVGTDQQFAGRSWLRELTDPISARSLVWIGADEFADAVRTPEWLCIRDHGTNSTPVPATPSTTPRIALFMKPEDIWDVNDIASQQPEIVSQLLSQFPAVQ